MHTVHLYSPLMLNFSQYNLELSLAWLGPSTHVPSLLVFFIISNIYIRVKYHGGVPLSHACKLRHMQGGTCCNMGSHCTQCTVYRYFSQSLHKNDAKCTNETAKTLPLCLNMKVFMCYERWAWLEGVTNGGHYSTVCLWLPKGTVVLSANKGLSCFVLK